MNAEIVEKELEKHSPYRHGIGRTTLCEWVGEDDTPLIETVRYTKLLEVLPDHIVENLERARLAQDGRIPMLKAGLGYEELLASVIVDGTAIASSSTEARLVPAQLIPKNYLQPGGIPGKTLYFKLRGRMTTLATAGTLTFRVRDGATDVFTNTICASGALTMDAGAQTNTMWFMEGKIVSRSVGSAGTVFGMGDCTTAGQAVTIANAIASYMGSAGSTAPSTLSVDMTTDRYWNWTAQWSLTTAYSIQAHQMTLEALN